MGGALSKRRSPKNPPQNIINEDHALIELSRGEFAIIDLEDYDRVSQYIWSVQIKKHLKYAVTKRPDGPGQMFLHQFVMNFPGEDVDHVNHNGLDNQKENLRLADDKQNQANQQHRSGGTSKYKGVCKPTQGNSWRASIMLNGTCKYLGSYKTEELAAEAYNKAAVGLRGQYALINTIEGNA